MNVDIKKTNFRSDINALRAFAVMSVVFYHFNIKGFSVGFIGVDIFFVISGYLMTQITLNMLEKNNFSYFKFIFARIKRIWPALIFLVLILLGIGAFLLPPADYVSLSLQAKDALLFISNIEFSNGVGYFTSSIEERWFLHSWSLSVEWQFYCIYPLLLYVIWNLTKAFNQKNQTNALNMLLLVVSVLSYSYSVYLTKQNQPQAFFSLGTRAWEMLMGAHVLLLAPTRIGIWFRSRANILKVISATLFILCVWIGRGGAWTSVWPGSYAILPVLATAIYLMASSSSGLWALLENNKITQSLGSWSYSIYLWHWPVVIAINFIGFSAIPLKMKLIGIALSIGLGFLSFKFIESIFREKQTGISPVLIKIASIYSLGLACIFYITTSSYFGSDVSTASNASSKLPVNFENTKISPDALLNVYRFNEQGEKKILVFGDSHAEHLYPWFKKNVTQHEVSFVVTNGCPPIPDMNRYDTTGWYCHSSFEKIRKLISQNKYDMIVVSGNWYPVDRAIPEICYYKFQYCKGIDPVKNREIAIHAFADFLNEINSKNIPVLIVKSTPFADYAIGKLVPRYHLWGLKIPDTFYDQDGLKKNGDRFIDDAVRNVRSPGLIYTADLKAAFCQDSVCQYLDEDSVPVFWDNNHFTSEWIVKHGNILNIINNILNNKKNIVINGTGNESIHSINQNL